LKLNALFARYSYANRLYCKIDVGGFNEVGRTRFEYLFRDLKTKQMPVSRVIYYLALPRNYNENDNYDNVRLKFIVKRSTKLHEILRNFRMLLLYNGPFVPYYL